MRPRRLAPQLAAMLYVRGMTAWRICLVAWLASCGCKGKRVILTDEQVIARPFEALVDVCLPRGADDDIVVIDTIYSGVEPGPDDDLSDHDRIRRNNRLYYRLVRYDAASGARRPAIVIGEHVLAERDSKGVGGCVGWIGSLLWLRGRDGLHARDRDGVVVVRETDLVKMHGKLAAGITQASYLAEREQLLVRSRDGYELLVSGAPELVVEPATEPVRTQSYATGLPPHVQSIVYRGVPKGGMRPGTELVAELRGGRLYMRHGENAVGDFMHPIELLWHAPSRSYEWDDQTLILFEPQLDGKTRKVMRIGLDGVARWTVAEPEPCAASPNMKKAAGPSCPQATWQATADGTRLYFFGERKLHAYDARRGTLLWEAPY